MTTALLSRLLAQLLPRLVRALALGVLLVAGCASHEGAASTESNIEMQKTRITELVRLTGELRDASHDLERIGARFAATRRREDLEAVRSEVGAITNKLGPVLDQLRDRLRSPTLPLELKQGGYLDVPKPDVDAQLGRLEQTSTALQAIEPGARDLLHDHGDHGTDGGHGPRPSDEVNDYLARLFAIAPLVDAATAEFQRWLTTFVKTPTPEWALKLGVLFVAHDPAQAVDQMRRYREQLHTLFPTTLENESSHLERDSAVAFGDFTFGGRTGGERLDLQTLSIEGNPSEDIDAAELSWFRVCLDALSSVRDRVTADRRVVAAGCDTAKVELASDSLPFRFKQRSDMSIATTPR